MEATGEAAAVGAVDATETEAASTNGPAPAEDPPAAGAKSVEWANLPRPPSTEGLSPLRYNVLVYAGAARVEDLHQADRRVLQNVEAAREGAYRVFGRTMQPVYLDRDSFSGKIMCFHVFPAFCHDEGGDDQDPYFHVDTPQAASLVPVFTRSVGEVNRLANAPRDFGAEAANFYNILSRVRSNARRRWKETHGLGFVNTTRKVRQQFAAWVINRTQLDKALELAAKRQPQPAGVGSWRVEGDKVVAVHNDLFAFVAANREKCGLPPAEEEEVADEDDPLGQQGRGGAAAAGHPGSPAQPSPPLALKQRLRSSAVAAAPAATPPATHGDKPNGRKRSTAASAPPDKEESLGGEAHGPQPVKRTRRGPSGPAMKGRRSPSPQQPQPQSPQLPQKITRRPLRLQQHPQPKQQTKKLPLKPQKPAPPPPPQQQSTQQPQKPPAATRKSGGAAPLDQKQAPTATAALPAARTSAAAKQPRRGPQRSSGRTAPPGQAGPGPSGAVAATAVGEAQPPTAAPGGGKPSQVLKLVESQVEALEDECGRAEDERRRLAEAARAHQEQLAALRRLHEQQMAEAQWRHTAALAAAVRKERDAAAARIRALEGQVAAAAEQRSQDARAHEQAIGDLRRELEEVRRARATELAAVRAESEQRVETLRQTLVGNKSSIEFH